MRDVTLYIVDVPRAIIYGTVLVLSLLWLLRRLWGWHQYKKGASPLRTAEARAWFLQLHHDQTRWEKKIMTALDTLELQLKRLERDLTIQSAKHQAVLNEVATLVAQTGANGSANEDQIKAFAARVSVAADAVEAQFAADDAAVAVPSQPTAPAPVVADPASVTTADTTTPVVVAAIDPAPAATPAQ